MQDSHFGSTNHFRLGDQGDVALSRTASGTVAFGTGAFGAVDGTVVSAQDIVQDANGGQWVSGSSSELLTLSTSGATTDTTANLLPANSVIHSVVARVVTAITTATDWKLGDATTAGRFSAADATLTAGETQVGLVHQAGNITTTAAGPTQAAAAKVRVTTTGTPGAGAIRITVFWSKFIAPTS